MRELKAQKEIVSMTFEQKSVPSDSAGLQTYRFLVQYRFFEVLSNSFPIFYSLIERKRFEKVVIAFMQNGANSNVMWKVPNEFRKFIKKNKYFKDIPYVDDLLWFEWIEVALMMKNYIIEEKKPFDFKKEYTLNESAILKKLRYKVFEEGSYAEKGEFFLLAYYDFNEHKVYFREISLVLYLFLKRLKKEGLKAALKELAKKTDEDKKTVKEFFKTTLEELNSLHVLKRR